MQHIRESLANFHHAPATPDLKMSEEETEEMRQIRLQEWLRLDLRVSDLSHTFENWEHSKTTEPIYQAFWRFATEEDTPPLLTCYGAVGNGKTYLLEATSIEIYRRTKQRRRVHVFRTIFDSLMEAIRYDNHEPDRLSYSQRLDNWCKGSILLIDDVGMGMVNTEKARNLQFSILEAIIVYRHYERLKTAMVTNIDPVEFPDRIRSRITDRKLGTLVFNEGKDYRRKRL